MIFVFFCVLGFWSESNAWMVEEMDLWIHRSLSSWALALSSSFPKRILPWGWRISSGLYLETYGFCGVQTVGFTVFFWFKLWVLLFFGSNCGFCHFFWFKLQILQVFFWFKLRILQLWHFPPQIFPANPLRPGREGAALKEIEGIAGEGWENLVLVC